MTEPERGPALGHHGAAAERMQNLQGSLLHLLSEARIDTLPLADAIRQLTEQAVDTLNVARSSVWRFSPDRTVMICVDIFIRDGRRHEDGAVIKAADYPEYFRALHASRALAAADAHADPRTREFSAGYLTPLGIGAMLDATLRRGGQTVGVVCHEHVGGVRPWTPEEQHFAAAVADIVTLLIEAHERRELLEKVQSQARSDGLTQLPNRFWLREHLDARVTPCALLLVNLDRFRDINDTLGSEIGDNVLRALAVRLAGQLPEGGHLARVGSDEFALILPGTMSADSLVERGRSIQTVIGNALHVDGLDLVVGSRVGISRFPEDGEDARGLLRCADIALEHARRTLRGCQIYSKAEDVYSPRRLTLMHALRGALDSDGLRVIFEPKIDLVERRVVGAEALSRWSHPQFGQIPPSEFIPLARMGDLMLKLTVKVIAEAGRAWTLWKSQGLELETVSVNLSPRLLSDDAAVEVLVRSVAATGLPPGRLELEITEDALMDDPDVMLAAMTRLREAGALFSLDDFGVGYSSLTHLSRMPLQTLKIDRCFIEPMQREPAFGAIVRSVIQLGRNLGLTVVAEGVETQHSCDVLAGMGCPQVQGFLFGRGADAGRFADMVEALYKAGPLS